MKLLSGLLGFGMIAAAISLGSPPSSFINVPSLLIVLGGTLLLSLAHHAPQDLWEAHRASLGHAELHASVAARHMAVLQTMRVLAIGTGLVGTIIGLVQMLQNMEDPSKIGPAMAVALLTAFYGIAWAELLLAPLINRLASRVTSSAPAGPRPANPSMLAALTIPVILAMFFVMIASLHMAA